MPSNTSMNLKTSAAAAFCARLIVHPCNVYNAFYFIVNVDRDSPSALYSHWHLLLTNKIHLFNIHLVDNVKVSIQSYQGVPVGLVPRLEHLLTTLRQQLHVKHRKNPRHQIQYHHQFKQSYSSASTPRHFYQEKISLVRGLYRGVPFALIFQVPGLALFLSTYDATKHALAQTAQATNLHAFQLHDFETHLVSGMIARAAGSIVWAPMGKLQSLAAHPSLGQAQLGLRDAFRLTKQICNSEGIAGMWSGYTKTVATLLPYTMLYFATYEHFKQFARKIVASGSENDDQTSFPEKLEHLMTMFTSSNYGSHSSVELSLQTYMVCITSAVATSSTICQSAIVVRDRLLERQARLAGVSSLASEGSTITATSRRPPILSNLLQTMGSARQEIVSPLASPTRIVSPLSAASAISTSAGASAGFRHHPLMPQFKALMSNTSQVASQAMSGLPWQQAQHATLTTTSSTSGLLPFRTGMKAHLSHSIKAMEYRQIVAPMTHAPSMTHSSMAHFSSHNIISRPLGALTPHTLMNNTMAATSTMTTSSYGHVQATTPMTSHAMITRYDSNDTRMTKHSNGSQLSQQTQAQSKTPGLVRTIARGLGPRIAWTVPGVALTTAGFEVLRHMASS
ncbi:hypothetical protein BGZ59_011531 [Podila verticillata]|nr:hypothetical protein BGZ59_011531 [Podila verticillata]